MKKILETINDYGKMVKFSHTLFALPFAGLATILALIQTPHSGNELIKRLILILICMVSARNAAMGFNRSIDSDIDAKNPRTAVREIPSGKLSKKAVNAFTIIFSLIFIVSTYFINNLAFYLSLPALAIVLFYSYTKRFTWLCHYILGFGIGIAPTGAWIAINDSFSLIPVLWSLGLMFHIAGFDILYSTQDAEFDKANGLHSIPSRFGIKTALWIARFNHIISFALLFSGGYMAGLGLYYFIFLILTAGLFIAEHILVSPQDLSKIHIAFFHINASISIVIFVGILLDKWSELVIAVGDKF
ncbi:MAG: putative 4-hydroxybenzoate polyprenyltransferase [Leptospiraceae bacterium]|nr:putative 4-hydroxybenzoate polyprenyltransferase [Leptospiraceae bacterium]